MPTEQPIHVPYEDGRWVRYVWLKNGEKAGDYKFRVEPDSADRTHHRVTAQLDYHHDGRTIRMEMSTKFGERLEPLECSQEVAHSADGLAGAGFRMKTTFVGEKVATEILWSHEQDPIRREQICKEPAYIYEDLAFDHWAMLAPVLKERGAGTYPLLRPSSGKTYKTEFRPLGRQQFLDKNAELWSFDHPEFSGKLWISEDGMLLKYQQGIFEAVLSDEQAAH